MGTLKQNALKLRLLETAFNTNAEITVTHPIDPLAVSHIFVIAARARAAVAIPSVFFLFTLCSSPSLSGEPSPYMDQAL